MEQVPVLGGTLESAATGSGEPVLFVHGSFIADAFAPLRAEKALADRYRLITYNRRGFGGSVHHTGPFSIADQPRDSRAVLEVKQAHIVGHSYGCRVAVELALNSPEIVATLTFAEPGGPPTPAAAEFGAGLQEIRYLEDR